MSPLSILVAFLSFLGGLWGAVYLQDRQVRRRHLGIVRALRAELRRVHSEGALENTGFHDGFGGVTLIPQLAPWVQGLLVELASGDTDYLREFMDLDRYLHNLAIAAPRVRDTQAHLTRMTDQLDFTEKSIPDDTLGILKCCKLKEEAEDKLRDAQFIADTDHKLVKGAVSDLLARIGRDEPRLASALRTNLPWRRPAR